MNMYNSPKPEGYQPNTPNQFREPTVDDCTWYATEYAFEKASKTHRSVHPVKGLRRFSTDTFGGTPVSVAIRDTLDLWPKSEEVAAVYGAYHKDAIVRALKRGATLILGGDYINLPAHYRRWTNNDDFAHAIAVSSWNEGITPLGETWMYDPLGGGPTFQPYDGEWIQVGAILRYTWQNNRTQSYWVGIVEPLGDDELKSLNVNPEHPADKEGLVSGGTKLQAAPRTTSDVVRTINNERWLPLVGAARHGWWLTEWNLGLSKENIGYLHNSDILRTRDVPFDPVTPVPPPSTGDNTELEHQLATVKNNLHVAHTLIDEYEDAISRIRDELVPLP